MAEVNLPGAVRAWLSGTDQRLAEGLVGPEPVDPALVVGPAGELEPGADSAAMPVPDGPGSARIEWLDPAHAILVEAPSRGGAVGPTRTRLTLGPIRRGPTPGSVIREVVVDGWRFEVELEPEARARLRERAGRGSASAGAGHPVEVRSGIPGRVAAIAVAQGDAVTAGQALVVVEAMKMLNEVKAPRAGTIRRVVVAVGAEVDPSDVLAILE